GGGGGCDTTKKKIFPPPLLDPVRLHRFEAGPVPSTGAVDLAALHREAGIAHALIARHYAELEARRMAMQMRVIARRAAGRSGAHNGLRGQSVLKGLDLGSVHGDADPHAAGS